VVSAPRVLVVEDEPAIREVVALVLADDGCEVRARDGGREALRLLRRWQPDVVVLDLRLPDREGEAFLDVCRQYVAGETPILVMSASANLDHHAARLGVDGILPKPFDIDELCRAVHRLAVDRQNEAVPQTGSPASATGPSVQIWLTTRETAGYGQGLTPQAARTFGIGSGSEQSIDVDDSRVFQEIDGFGASLTEASAKLISDLPTSVRAGVLRNLFDRGSGIGLSYIRLPMGVNDFSLTNSTYEDVRGQFSIDPDRRYVLPVLQQIRGVNGDIKIMASPWTAPAWMKWTRIAGGGLRPDRYGDYANYFVKFIRAYAQEGIPIHTITVQNEPHNVHENQPSMWMSARDQAVFIGDHLGPAFQSAGIGTKILAWDTT
jgi:CheY-like chemotaxis protein